MRLAQRADVLKFNDGEVGRLVPCLQYYGRRYLSIETRQTLTLQEMTDANGCRVME